MKLTPLPYISIRRIIRLAVLIALINLSPWVEAGATEHATAVFSGQELVHALRQGGYTIYFRHEATDWSQMDSVQQTDDWLSCDGSRIRQLSLVGRQSAVTTGRAIQSLAIPIGEVFASPYCRTMETAKLMGFGEVTPTYDVINMRIADYFGGRTAVAETARRLLAQSPPKNLNTLIVAHGNVAQASTPVYPGEGEGLVFKADGSGGFHFIGRLSPAEWQSLAKTAAP